MGFGGGGRVNGFSVGLLQSFDPLGLPTNLLLLSGEERKECTAKTLALAAVAHANLVRDLGEKRAQAEWRKLARGRQGRRKDAERDQLLLAEYDSFVAGKTTEEINEKHDWEAVTNREGKTGVVADELAGCRVIFQEVLGAGASKKVR
jgi:hypothetical protein